MKGLVLAVLVLAGVGDAAAQAPATKRPAPASPAQDSAVNALLERADAGRIQGMRTAPVWIVEVSDFQCPFCKQWHDKTYPIIRREFIEPGIVRMAYVNLPLNIHQHALPAALTAMCAAAQNRFWPVHDKLFATQARWAAMTNVTAIFDSLALAGGVDAAQWRACMRSGVMQRVISGDQARASAARVRSTPTFFIGDQMIEGVAPIEEFRAAIQRAREKAGGRTPH